MNLTALKNLEDKIRGYIPNVPKIIWKRSLFSFPWNTIIGQYNSEHNNILIFVTRIEQWHRKQEDSLYRIINTVFHEIYHSFRYSRDFAVVMCSDKKSLDKEEKRARRFAQLITKRFISSCLQQKTS